MLGAADAALTEIERCAGAQFDPELVRLFIEVIVSNHTPSSNISPPTTNPPPPITPRFNSLFKNSVNCHSEEPRDEESAFSLGSCEVGSLAAAETTTGSTSLTSANWSAAIFLLIAFPALL
ncbi:MAG TPA: hypothetical protein VGR84_07115 [Candidatus Acidoferrales bacterium]|nr:hypothetical protein [Candidatus Acidoferrales bacterium]